MSTGFALFQKAELAYSKGDSASVFTSYQASIKKILKDENPTAPLPYPASALPPDCPRERNFAGFFRDPRMGFTRDSSPAAYKLLASFRPGTSHPRLEKTDEGKVLLKGMQITAAFTLGLLAWDECDHATVAKRYYEGIALAGTNMLPPGTVGMALYVHNDLQETKENLEILIESDRINAELLKSQGRAQPKRREVALSLSQVRVDKTGATSVERMVEFATNACNKCGKRDMKLLVCSSCKKAYCKFASPI
ncbi:hypothetical protein DXG01_008126 [Tephrocybe rancida]|nr:hypothetical protein DXG01_008126 [Tephrocybe rancida]